MITKRISHEMKKLTAGITMASMLGGCASGGVNNTDPGFSNPVHWYTLSYNDGETTVMDVAVGAVVVVGVIVTAGALISALDKGGDNNTYYAPPPQNNSYDSEVARELCRLRLQQSNTIGTCR